MTRAVSDTLALHSASHVTRLLTQMFEDDGRLVNGVTHVVAVATAGSKNLVLRTAERAFSSMHDEFVLGVARARADAIITTGEILRSEPALRLDVFGPGRMNEALADWRRSSIRKAGFPRTLLLTSGRDVSLEHPVFNGANAVSILTGKTAPTRLVSEARERGIHVLQVDEPGVRTAVDGLRDDYGLQAISIEAGPSTATELYRPPVMVNEIFLSQFHGPVSASSIVGAFLDTEVLLKTFVRRHPPHRVSTDDGTWSFHHLVHQQVTTIPQSEGGQ